MKIPIIAIVLLAIGSVGLRAQTSTTAAGQGNVPAPTDYQIVEQDGNSRVWQREIYEQEPNGQIISRPHKFTELATGLNYRDPSTGQWQPSKEEIDIQPDGTLAATQGQHQVFFPANIYGGEIELVQPNGVRLHSCPVGLSYDDGSNTVLIAVLTNSIGQLIGSNQVIYTNAFVGLDADLLYTYTKSGLEQDVVIRTQPPTPASLGLNPDATRLQMLTEFFNPPQPVETTSTLPEQAGLLLTDDTLDFGAMQMIPGKAFMLGDDSPSVLVGKSWMTLQGRQFLVEAVPVAAMAEQLDGLPAPSAQTVSTVKTRVISRNLVLPPQHLAKAGIQPLKLAGTGIIRKPGVVLDYLTENSSQTNYTFRADTTYYISGGVTLYGTNTFEGGAVLKFAATGIVKSAPTASIIWKGSIYRPVIFTAKDDNSVGDVISGSTGSPSGHYYGEPMWYLTIAGTPPLNLTGLHVSYANIGIESLGEEATISDAQFIGCETSIYLNEPTTLLVRNALFSGVRIVFQTYDSSIDAQNVTVSDSLYLTSGSGGSSLTLSNSILSGVSYLTNAGVVTMNGSHNGFYGNSFADFGTTTIDSTIYPFQTVGDGGCYLTSGCGFYNAGTTNIDPTLLTNLATMTVYPPVVYSHVSISTPTILSPQAERDNSGLPSLGYHYAPIDYIVDELAVTNTTLTVSEGTVLADYNEPGIMLENGATIASIGAATAPNWFVRYSTVQEGTNALGGTNISSEMSICATNGTANGTFQFSKFSVPAGDGYHLYDNGSSIFGSLVLQDCELYGGMNDFSGGSSTASAALLNNLFQRSSIYASNTSASVTLTLTNNLFWGTTATISQPSGGIWSAFNNDFDSTIITNSTLTNGYNAYLNCTNFLVPTNTTDIFSNASLAYQSSWFGNFYQPTNSPLILKGSTTANLLGLYHFTTQTNQTIEGDSIVDIGYHYVATDQYGNPLDTNGDGIPDYIEDANGDGIFDAGDLGDWQISPYGLSGGNALQVFTPLK